MSRAETVLDEATAMSKRSLPKPGKYQVKSTGAPGQVPPEAHIDIVFSALGLSLAISGEVKGPVESLLNGDFKVVYDSAGILWALQFRQSDTSSHIYGVSYPEEVVPATAAGDDPPITGVWGADARPGVGTTEPEK